MCVVSITFSNDFTALSDDCGATGSATVTFTATDECGNTNVTSATFTIEDTTPPAIVELAGDLDATLECSDATGIAQALALAPTATETCSSATIHVLSDDITPGTCVSNYVRTRTWNFTDVCGNTSPTFTQTITVSDNTAPTFTRPADIEIFTDANCGYDASVGVTGDVSNELDNCSTGLQATFTDVTVDGPCAGRHVITRTWHLVDNCGNAAADQVQTITVTDNIKPTITAGTIPFCFGSSGTAVDAVEAATIYSDNCTSHEYLEGSLVTETSGPACNRVIKVTVTDECGNSNSVTYNVRIDAAPPTITGTLPIANIEGCGVADAPAAATSVLALEGMGLAISDGCTADALLTVSSADVVGSYNMPYCNNENLSITDQCGFSSIAVQTINIDDNTAPTFTRPADAEVFTNASCGYDASIAVTGDVDDEGDNCSTGLQATFTDVTVDGPCEGSHIITRTWHLVDNCGNPAADQVQTITVTDNTAPTFTRPADAEVFTNASCGYDASPAAAGDVEDEADNCSTGLQATFTDVTVDGPCEGSHIITRTWHLVDDCGNPAADQIQTITVTDNTAPTFTRPADMEVFTNASCGYDASIAVTGDVDDEADNCSTGLQATFTDVTVDGPCEGSISSPVHGIW